MKIADMYEYAKKHGLEYMDFEVQEDRLQSLDPVATIGWDKNDDVLFHKWVNITFVDGELDLDEEYTYTTSEGDLFNLAYEGWDELELTEAEIKAICEELDN